MRVGDEWTKLTTRILAPNPGPMTMDGTNSYVIRDPGSFRVIVVDPGPLDAGHLARLRGLGEVELILLTHRHRDHMESSARLSELSGAPVRAADSAICRSAPPLVDGEEIRAGGTRVTVIATPGHTDDSLCFHLPDDRSDAHASAGAVLTGDTVLGRGTTLVGSFEGSLGRYVGSLERLRGIPRAVALPGHGDLIHDLPAVCAVYLDHRERRLAATRDAFAQLEIALSVEPAVVDLVVDALYDDLHPLRRKAAAVTTRANIAHLIDIGHSTSTLRR